MAEEEYSVYQEGNFNISVDFDVNGTPEFTCYLGDEIHEDETLKALARSLSDIFHEKYMGMILDSLKRDAVAQERKEEVNLIEEWMKQNNQEFLQKIHTPLISPLFIFNTTQQKEHHE